MSTGTYDYTQHDAADAAAEAAAAAAAIDDYEIADARTAEKSADQLEDENSFKQIPPGDRMLVVVGFTGPPKNDLHRVFVRGQLVGYYADTIGVEFAEAGGNPNVKIRDYFRLPPSGEPKDLQAYYEGKTDEDQKNNKAGGFAASKFLHFIDRLGFHYPPGGNLPPEARKLKNWKGRTIFATITPAKDYRDKKSGEMKKGYNNLKMFSYRATGQAGSPTAPLPTPSVPNPHAAPRQQAPAAANYAPQPHSGQRQAAAVGLNDL